MECYFLFCRSSNVHASWPMAAVFAACSSATLWLGRREATLEPVFTSARSLTSVWFVSSFRPVNNLRFIVGTDLGSRIWMAGLTVPLITPSSCHPPCHWPITFCSASPHILREHTSWCECECRTCHLSVKAPIWSFLLSDIISCSCFSTRKVSLLGVPEIATDSTPFNQTELETSHGADKRKACRVYLNLDKIEWLKLSETHVSSLSFIQFMTALITVTAMAMAMAMAMARCPRCAAHHPN